MQNSNSNLNLAFDSDKLKYQILHYFVLSNRSNRYCDLADNRSNRSYEFRQITLNNKYIEFFFENLFVGYSYPSWHFLAQIQQWKYQNNVQNLFKVNNKIGVFLVS